MAVAFLTAKGRILYDGILHYIDNITSHTSDSGSFPSKVIVETSSSSGEQLVKHLLMYKMRSKVKINMVSDLTCIVSRSDDSDSISGVLLGSVGAESIISTTRDPRMATIGDSTGGGDNALRINLDRTLISMKPGKIYIYVYVYRYKSGTSSSVYIYIPIFHLYCVFILVYWCLYS